MLITFCPSLLRVSTNKNNANYFSTALFFKLQRDAVIFRHKYLKNNVDFVCDYGTADVFRLTYSMIRLHLVKRSRQVIF